MPMNLQLRITLILWSKIAANFRKSGNFFEFNPKNVNLPSCQEKEAGFPLEIRLVQLFPDWVEINFVILIFDDNFTHKTDHRAQKRATGPLAEGSKL
jgi:hypothetical protein